MSKVKNKKENVFDQFTGKYSLSKTLRFELKPVGNTQQMLEDENVFEVDRIIHEKYKQTKPYFDRLHREFIKDSLRDAKISKLQEYFTALKAVQKNKKDTDTKNNFQKISKELRTELNKKFNTADLFSEQVFSLLKDKYGKEEGSFLKDEETGDFTLNENGEKISIFDSWKGFSGYFTKFQETRKNFYKDDGKAGRVTTRIVDQNLARFCDNLQLFESVQNKINFSEVEKIFDIKISEFFILDFYNSCLLQDDIDYYNQILGGKTLENGEKIKGLNEIINKYRQDRKEEKISFFKMLDKQILSEKEEFIENIKDGTELLERLKEFRSAAEEKTKVLQALFGDFVKNNDAYDLSKVYISKEGLNTILMRWMTTDGRSQFEKNIFEQNKKEKIVESNKDDDSYDFPDFLALSYIKSALDKGEFENKEIWRKNYYKNDGNPKGFLKEGVIHWRHFLEIFSFEFNRLFEGDENDENQVGYYGYKKAFEKIIAKKEKSFSVSSDDKLVIKNFVDNTLWIYQMAKYFAIEKKRKWLDTEYETDSNFYEHLEWGFYKKFYADAYDKIIKRRMLLQSYLTKKPFNTDKWKLNFENPTLADGWDKNKESDNSSVILRKDDQYYLAIMKKGNNKLFDDKNKDKFLSTSGEDNYKKMVYKLLPGASKMLPKVFFSKSNIDYFSPSSKVLGIRNHSSHTKNGQPQEGFEKKDFNLSDCHAIIDFFKKSIAVHKDWKNFGFTFSPTKQYKDTSDFYREVEAQGYKIDFQDISEEYITEKNNNDELYLFKIHNKDWNLKDGKKKTGTKNIHTTYFESLFSDENKELNFPFKLNGEAELFYRPKTDEKRLGSKFDTKGNKVISHKRYSENKTFLHIPITLNRTAGDIFNFNKEVNNFLLNNPGINIIGLDRGEKHLIYYAGIDQKGDFLQDKDGEVVLGSLNIINGVDYHSLLETRAGENIKNKQDWQEIEGIKDLKKGYISLVVRKLADLIVEHNAVLVFEDLNMRFKQIRGGIEKSVYQQLEKALLDKLNFLVNKGEKDPEAAGHLLRAYQLTSPFTTFKDMGKQTGVIFYTQASYTSKTCPDCGFRPNVKWEAHDLKDKIKNNKISFNYKDGAFTISYTLSDFIKNQNPSKRGNILYEDKEKKNDFTISTKDAVRYKWFKRELKKTELLAGERKMKEQTGKGETVEYNITECIKGLFDSNDIDYNKDIISQLQEKESKLLVKFYNKLSFYLYTLINTRSSVSGTDIDYINCSSCGCGFHSKKGFRGIEFNGDANGAYNIARKGIMILQKINQYQEQNGDLDKMDWGHLFIDTNEWDKFTQK